MTTMLEYLQAIQPMPKELIEDLRRVIKVKEVSTRYMWLGEDEISNSLSFIEKGLFRSFVERSDGKEVCVAFYKEGQCFTSSTSFYNQETTIERIQALEDSKVHYIRYKDYNKLCNKYPLFNLVVTKVIGEILIESQSNNGVFRIPEPRLRVQIVLNERPDLFERVSLPDMASYLEMEVVDLIIYMSEE